MLTVITNLDVVNQKNIHRLAVISPTQTVTVTLYNYFVVRRTTQTVNLASILRRPAGDALSDAA
jgi:aspartate carbamoyltransferase regulatory subunit